MTINRACQEVRNGVNTCIEIVTASRVWVNARKVALKICNVETQFLL